MVRNPLLEEEELRRELDVVCEEIRAADADPESLLSDLVQAACRPDHPYGRRIARHRGRRSAHRRAPPGLVAPRAWRRAQLLVVLAGPLDAAEVVTEAERSQGQWTAGEPRRPALGARHRRGVARLTGDWSSTAMEITWPLPPAGLPRSPCQRWRCWPICWGLARRALLSQIIQHEEALAFNVWAECASGLGGSTFALGFVPLEKSGRKALERTFDLLDEIKVPPRGGAVTGAGAIAADFLFGGETVDQLTQDLAHYASHHGDPAAREAHRQALAQVSVTDVRDAARAWLGRDAAIIGVLDDGVSDAAARKLLAARAPVARKAGPVVFRHPKGPLVRIVPRTSRWSRCACWGAAAISARPTARPASARRGRGSSWLARGGNDPAGLGEAMDLAAEIDPYTSRQYRLGFAASAPASHALELLDLLSDVVLEPHLMAEELDRVREELLDDVRTQADRPSEVAANMTRAVRWAGHPWRLPTLGTEATLQRLTADGPHLAPTLPGRQDMVIGLVVGGVDLEAILRALAWLDGDPPGESALLAPRPAPRPRWGSTTIARAGNEQAHLVLFGGAPPALGIPLVLCYRANTFDYGLGQMLRKTGVLNFKRWGLPNIVLQEDIMPELLQYEASPGRLVMEVMLLLDDTPTRQNQLADLQRIRQTLGGSGVVERVARFTYEFGRGQTVAQAKQAAQSESLGLDFSQMLE